MGLKMRQYQKHDAYKSILNKAKVCINCVHAEPNPISECALVVTCMYKPFKRYKLWLELPYMFGFSRGRLYKSLRNYRGELRRCSKFEPRQNPILFLRQVLWIKRLVWHLREHKCGECSKERRCIFSHTIHAQQCGGYEIKEDQLDFIEG